MTKQDFYFWTFALFLASIIMIVPQVISPVRIRTFETSTHQVTVYYDSETGPNVENLLKEHWYDCNFDGYSDKDISEVYIDYFSSLYPNIPIYKVKVKRI